MVKYKLIIEYYQKGNNNSQIATLCDCSRTVVWEVLNRFNKIETIFADIQRMSEEEWCGIKKVDILFSRIS